MPLYKKKPFDLSKPPDDLKPKELVFQVRFTDEIFRNYEDYIKRITLYRQKVWTCKVTGKSNLTYEEALASERKGIEQVQQFPKEFMGPVLNLVQFSVLRFKELVNTIVQAFKDCFVVGEELFCVQGNSTSPCRVIKAIASDVESSENSKLSYEVAWLDSDKNVMRTSVESADKLMRKKPPFTRALLMSFIRESVEESAVGNAPWVVHEQLCYKYGLCTEPPEELKKFFMKRDRSTQEAQLGKRSSADAVDSEGHAVKKQKTSAAEGVGSEGCVVKKSKKTATEAGESEGQVEKKLENTVTGDAVSESHKPRKNAAGNSDSDSRVMKKSKKSGTEESAKAQAKSEEAKMEEVPVVKVEPIKYPIDDSLVQPSADDPPLQEKPVPSSDFPLPMECTGQLLMVWNFCVLFGKAIRLSPFSLEELEKALENKEGESVLLKEAHHALLKLVFDDSDTQSSGEERKRRKATASINTWKEDLSEFLNLQGLEALVSHASAIRKGKYRELEPSVKLEILCELVNHSLDSAPVRDQLDLYIEEKQAIAAQKRKEEVEESRRDKELQEQLKQAQVLDSTCHPTEEELKQVQVSDSTCHPTEDSARVYPENGDVKEPQNDGTILETNLSSNGLANGTHADGIVEGVVESDAIPASVRSRQLALKMKASLKEAEEREREKRRIEEQKKLLERKKKYDEARKERELQERKLIEQQKRQEHFEREIEKRVIRTNPLGRDKDYSRYWFFPREGRIFIEDQESTKWGYYSAKEELESLYASLNPKGIRERALQRQLEKHYSKISDALQKRSKELAQRVTFEDASVRRSSRGKAVSQLAASNFSYRNKYRNS